MVSLPLRSDATAKGVMNKINKHAGTAAAVCAGIIDEELLIRTTGPLRVNLARSTYAKSYWVEHVEGISTRLRYVPKFEEYINSVESLLLDGQ